MTGFRTSRFSGAVFCLAALTWTAGAGAQSSDSRPAAGPPATLGGSAPVTENELPPPTTETDNAGGPSGVQVRSLGALDGPAIGLLDAANGGLGIDIWQDAPRARTEDMLKRLPLATTVASVHALARRLVLTSADAPTGDAPQAFSSVRLRALLDAGLIEDAGNLAARITPKDDPELARLVADSLLFAGRVNDICGPATNMRLQSAERFWIRLRAFCYAAAGDSSALELTRAVMQAQKVDSHGFETLLDDWVSHRSNAPNHIGEPDALDVFLLHAAGLAVDPAWSQHMGMPLNIIAMKDLKDTSGERLEAAEEATRTGAVSAADIAIVADAQTFAPDQLAHADGAAPTLPFLAGQALLRQAVRNATDPAVKKHLLFEALALAYGKNLLPAGARLQGSAVSAVKPDPSDRKRATLVASALMLSGRAEAAARWYGVLDVNAPADKPLIHLLQAELNLVAPNPSRAFEARDALAWFAAQAEGTEGNGDDRTSSYALLVLGIYDALGMDMPPQSREALAALKSRQWQGRAPASDVVARVGAARDNAGRRGDAILSTLDFVGSDGPGDVAPDAIVTFVKALKEMGYTDAAHGLAVDALLLHRFEAPRPRSASVP